MRGAVARGAQRISEFADRVPLRVRLIAAVLALVSLAQVATGVAALIALDHYLTARLDGQLTAAARQSAQQLRHGATLLPGDLVRLDLPGAVYARVEGPGGRSGGEIATAGAPPRFTLTDASMDAPRTVTGADGRRWRLVVEPVAGSDDVLIMAVGLEGVSATVANLALIDIVVSGIVLVLLAGAGYLLVRASLRPLRQIEAVAAAITDGQLSQRVPERDPRTEVGRLGRAFNAMLTRIEGAFRDREVSEAQARASEVRMRRFIADASHELRTPLTSIRGFAELYRQGAATDAADVARFMGRIETESSRMGLLVEDLLLLARLDQQRPLRRRPVDLAVLAADAVHDARAVAPGRPIELRALGPATVDGDEPRLRQVIGNLVTNALTHTEPGTPVTVTVASVASGVSVASVAPVASVASVAPGDGATVVLEVADQGPGMAPEHAARAFERFYRADASRTRQTGGNGLGLAIAAAIVEAHSGTVEVETAPGEGATFRVRLPAGVPDKSPDLRRGAGPSQDRDSVREGTGSEVTG